jgi:hypothetical protein
LLQLLIILDPHDINQLLPSTAKSSGNGYSNNRIFGSSSDVQTGIPTTSLAFGNAAGQYKSGRYVDLSNNTASGIYGAGGLMLGITLKY